jgi:hypothetical protein
MAFFPNFSEIDGNIRTTLEGRKGKPLAVSNLNVWVKMTSAVGGGLILYSNPDFKLFKAAGDGNVSTIYGGNSQSGVLGVDWANKPVYASDGLGLYPRPVVTSIEIDEGAGNISRKATVSMTAFTKGQAELLSEYFLEPGYTVFFEFGWNTHNSVGQIVDTGADSIAEMQDIKKLIEKRANSNGTYENYLGYITGGNISLNGTSWDISINLTGFTELPLYLKTHEGLNVEDSENKTKETSDSLRYDTPKDSEPDGLRMFKTMFNDLPLVRMTQPVKDLEGELDDEKNFINFDEAVKTELNNVTDGTWVSRGLSFVGIDRFRSTAKVEGVSFEPPAATKIVDDDRFIRFGAMMRILQASVVDGFKLGNKEISVAINSSDIKISSFPNIFSLDKSKLFIPNPQSPNFSLSSVVSATEEQKNIQPNGIVDNSVLGVQFPQQTPSEGNIRKEARYWGYLDDLYVNFDFFKNVISTSNFDIRNVLYTILNGLSSAAGNIWDFQIVDKSDENSDKIQLSIVDLNFVPKTDKDKIYEFNLMGEQSIFISNTFDMDIGGQMMNHIISKRIGLRQSDERDISTEDGMFTDKEDQILPKIQRIELEETDKSNQNPTEPPTEREIKDKNLQLFLDTVGIFPRINNKNKIKKDDLFPNLYFATSTDKPVFDNLRSNTLISKKGNVTEEYSPLLPVKFSFKIHGISGIKRGDKFKVKGLPEQYYKNGFFQVTAVKHSVSGMKWETDVEGSYRRAL